MDFIPLPQGVTSHVLVPDLGGPDYDSLGFVGYDQRQGWDVKALREGRLYDARKDWRSYGRLWLNTVHPLDITIEQEGYFAAFKPRVISTERQLRRLALAAAFLQRWILHGILHVLLKRPVSKPELLDKAPKQCSASSVSTGHITIRCLYQEFLAERHSWRDNLPAAFQAVSCLREASMIVSNFVHTRIFPKDSTVLQSVFFALAALIEECYLTLRVFCQPLTQDVPVFVRQVYFAERLQVQRGWCPHMVRRIGLQLRISGLYYASLVPHLITDRMQIHNQCNRDICVGHNTTREGYKLLHVPKYCACLEAACEHTDMKCPCRAVATPQESSRTAFEDGTFPLVSLQGNSIEITKYKAGMKFIAISHPWSDGRGNPYANAIPTCQLREINAYVTEHRYREGDVFNIPVTLFWIDSLCVPLEEPLRNTAIQGMAMVYSSAYRVLVLSAELTSIKVPSTAVESLVRIYCSKWYTRLWLLHEAALASDLRFQFSNYAQTHDTYDANRDQEILNPADQTFLLLAAAQGQVNSTVGINQSDNANKHCSLDVLWRGLRNRTSSRPSDAAICCSILLGTDLARVLAVPDDQKIQAFWACQHRLPTTILFVQGPHLTTEGFRWAPSNLLDPKSLTSALIISSELGPGLQLDAKLTTNGLLVRGLKAIVINFPKRHRSKLHIYRFSLPGSSLRYYFMLGGRFDPAWGELVTASENDWDGRCMFLLDGGSYGTHVLESAAITVPTSQPVQFSCSIEATNCLYTKYIQPVAIWHEEEPETRIAFAIIGRTANNWVANLGRKAVTDMGEVQVIGASQDWCVY